MFVGATELAPGSARSAAALLGCALSRLREAWLALFLWPCFCGRLGLASGVSVRVAATAGSSGVSCYMEGLQTLWACQLVTQALR